MVYTTNANKLVNKYGMNNYVSRPWSLRPDVRIVTKPPHEYEYLSEILTFTRVTELNQS